MVKRGPQWVQVRKGWRWRRSAGSVSSARQASQVAASGETRVRERPSPREEDAEGGVAGHRDVLGLDGLDHGQRWRLGADPPAEHVERGEGALDLGDDALAGVGHMARQAQFRGEGVDERAEADALDDAAHGDPTACGGARGGRRDAPVGLPDGHERLDATVSGSVVCGRPPSCTRGACACSRWWEWPFSWVWPSPWVWLSSRGWPSSASWT